MKSRLVGRARPEEETGEDGDGLLGFVLALQFGIVFWGGLALVIWIW